MNFRKILLGATGLFCLVTSQLAAQTRDTGREVMRGEINFTDLANYQLAHPEPLVRKDVENEEDEDGLLPRANHSISDSSLIRTRATSPHAPSAPAGGGSAYLPISPAPNDTFESTIDNNTTIPPDTHGAVDSNYCMTTINSTVKIQTRAGGGVSSVTLNSFFSPLVGSGVYDPRVHYDIYTHRWIFIADYGAEATTSSLLIAISKTSNPTGAWWEFKVTADASGVNWLDFPEVGFNGKWITVTGNMFTVAASDFTEAKVFVFNKANLLAGTSATYTSFTKVNNFTLCPTLTYDATEQSMFIIQDWNAGLGYLQLLKIVGTVGAEVIDTVGYPSVTQTWQQSSFQNSGTGGADFAPQVGVAHKIQTNDDRFDQMTYINGHLWFAHTIFLPYSTTVNATRSSIQWWETDTTGTPLQLGNIDDATNTNFYAFPSLAVNTNNDVLIGFAAFSATTHPSGAYAVRYHTDPTDSIRPLQIFRHGQNTYYKTYSGSDNRWGDYSGAVMDPLNQTDFWTIQEASSATADDWDTWWANVVLCTAPVAITGTQTVCAGATTTLADATSAGTWSSSNTAAATVGSTGIVSGVASGTTTISYSTGANCAATAVVTVNPLPLGITGTGTVCVGLTTTLADATTGGSWASGTTAAATVGTGAGTVTGVATGTSIISYTLATGCRATSIVTVNSTAPAITGLSPVCVGSAITLTDPTTGGTWTSGTTTVATVITASGSVTGAGSGTSTITYLLSAGCTATAVVTVNLTPSTITGSLPVCAGSTITLAEVTTGGTWASGTASVATIGTGSPIVSGVAPGTSVISYTLGTGCSATTIITVNTTPSAITGSTPVCAGSTVTLGETTTGGTWASGSTTIATVLPGAAAVYGVAPGTSILTYALGTGCNTTTIVTVNAVPSGITGSAPFCAGSTLTLGETTTGGTWASSSTTIATVLSGSPTVSGVAAGTATITYALGTGCNTTTILTVNTTPSGITGATPVCAGSTVTLGETTTGGTWASSNTAAATVLPGSSVVSGVAPGTATITYALGTGCNTTVDVTVNLTPSGVTGSTPVCAGAGISLNDATTGGTWSSSSTGVATVVSGSGAVAGVAPGTATITYALGTGCSAAAIVTVNASPLSITGSTPTCAGSMDALADLTTGGAWSSNATTVATVLTGSGDVSGVAPGTATITYALGSGCSATAIVTINTMPSAITGSLPVCMGSTVTLSETTTGGTWSSSSTTVATVLSGSPIVSGAGAGTATITYAMGTGCSATIVVTVNSLPSGITGSVPVCAGSSVTLGETTTGGTWSSGSTTVATVLPGSGSVAGVAPGTSTITYTLGTGCSVTAIVTVNIAPAGITGSTSVCAGSTVTLGETTTGGTWSSGSTTIATVLSGSPAVSGVAPGTAAITYALGTGCNTTTIVTVNTTPSGITGSTPVCAGSTVTLGETTTGGTWASSATATATVLPGSSVVSGATPGTATITYALGTGCNTTVVVTVNLTPAGITGSTPVCVGAGILLSDATTGGAWSSSSTTIATVIAGTGAVTGVAPGTAAITYALGTGCSATTIVTVNSSPLSITGTTPVCAGSALALADLTSGGAWSSSSTTVATVLPGSGNVSGVAPGTATITYSLGAGCVATTVVTVNSTPSAITGSDPVCAGSTVTLGETTTGGTWASGSTTIATVLPGSPTISGVAPGTSIITYALATGCNATAIVTVNAIPSGITGSAPVCAGSTVTLGETTTGGTWGSGSTAIATVLPGSPVVSGVSPGTATITYTLSTGCNTSLVVTVNVTPSAITGSVPVCVGSTVTLGETTTGGTWASGSTTIATVLPGSPTISGVAPGTSIITYALATGCNATTIVTVNAIPSGITGSTPVCAGSTVTLGETTTGGTWSSGSTAIATVLPGSPIVSGASPGTATITYTLSTGCNTSIVVTVNLTPLAITGSAPVCAGSTVTLGETTTGGTWASGSTTIATVLPGSPTISGVAPGTSIITYALATGCNATAIVTVNAIPSGITGSSPVCAGSTVTLGETTTGGTWSSGSITIATVLSGSPVVSGASPGTATITYTLSTGCNTSIVVTVNLTPSGITGSAPVCAGSTVTLGETTTGGTWASGSTTIATVLPGSPTISGVAPGTSIITYALATGCNATTIVTVNAIPSGITGSSPVCAGSTVTLGETTTGGTWSSGSTTIATVLPGSPIVSGVSPGTATITYTLSTGCNTSIVVTVNLTPLAITGSAPVCAGSIVTLGETTTGGTWASGSTSIATVLPGSGAVSGAGPGTATITYALSTGCSTTATVTVNAIPPAISGSVPFCATATITLTDGTTGGAWASDNTAAATVIAGSGTIHGVAGGTATITYTLSAGCTATTIVTVNPLPSGITGPGRVCVSAAITLMDASTGGTWTSGTTTVATAILSSGSITGAVPGASIITYTLGTGCTTSTIITVNPLPLAISGGAIVCTGSTANLADGTSGGTWSSSATGIATVGSTGIVGGVAAGPATITYTLSTGCYITSPITGSAPPAAISGSATVCAGSAITLADGTSGGTWSSSSTSAATINSAGGVLGIAAGTTTISYILGTGCFTASHLTVNPLPAGITGGSSVCLGSTRLLADDTTGGTWSSSATGMAPIAPTGVVSGVAAGPATITYTLGTGCYVTSPVTVNALPSNITGGTTVCAGSTRILADVTTGGTWSSSATGAATVNSTGTIGGVAAGTATISYTASTGCSAALPITVNPVPAIITGVTSVCTGSTVTVADGTTGGTWSSSATGAATIGSTGAVGGVAAGPATITYTLSSTGCYATFAVTDNDLPATISGPSTVCTGASVTLTDGTSGGVWSSNNTSVAAVIADGTVTGATSGTATIVYTLGSGCSVTKLITVNPLPSAITGATSVCIALTTALTDAGGGAWSSNNTTVATVGSAGLVTGGAISGTATITYMLATGCFTTTMVTVNLVPASITGPSSVCIGSVIALTDAGGGTWSSSSTSVATVVSATGSVSGAAPGTATITFTVSAGCSASSVVTVNSLPSPITGTAGICMGLTTTLNDGTSGGTWGSDNTSVATVGAIGGVVSGVVAGTSAITYTAPTGCTATKAITVNSLPLSITGTAFTACTGQMITLSDGGAGTWGSGNTAVATITSTTGIVAGIIPGTTTITYTLSATGCTAATIVTVNATPPAIFGVSGVCTGSSTGLTDATAGGAWTSASAAVTVDSVSGNVAGVTAGAAIITYTLAGCATTKSLTVNPLATIAGATAVCAGSSVTLTPSIGLGTWSSSSTGVATVSAVGGVTSIAPGIVDVTYTLPTGCATITTITVNPVPGTIGGTLHVCQGATATLIDAITGGAWASTNTAAASIDAATGVVTGGTPGAVVISYSLGSGCNILGSVTVNPAPSAITGPGSVCDGQTISLADAGSGTWSSSNTAAATVASSSSTVAGVSPGTTTITYTLSTGCNTAVVISVNPAPSAISGPSSICPGAAITLSDVTTGGTWGSAGTSVTVVSATGNVTGVAAGTALITYSLGSCSSTMAITVNPIAAITGAGSVCAGSSIILADALSGGAWSSSGTGIATIAGATGVVAGTAPGTASITYTLPTGCVVSDTITVHPLPAAITGTAVVCAGASASLADVTSGGTWSSGSTGVATIGTAGSFTGVAAGTATITYTNISGCIVTAVVTVNPLPAPIATSPINVCVGLTVPLSGTGSGTWASSNTSVVTIDVSSGFATAITAGTATITYTLPTGCSSTAAVVVDSLPTAIPGIDSVCVGATATLGNPGGGTWSSSNTAIASIDPSLGIIDALSAGTVSITYTLPSGCFMADTLKIVVCPGSSVTQVTAGGHVSVLPNPNKGEFTVSGTLNTAGNEDVSLEITDLLGQGVYKATVTAVNGKLNEHIKLSGKIANGMYVLSLYSATDIQVFHIIIEQ